MKQITSLIAVERATCSTSVADRETVVCNLECHAMGQFAQKITNPVLDEHARGSGACSGVQFPAKSACFLIPARFQSILNVEFVRRKHKDVVRHLRLRTRECEVDLARPQIRACGLHHRDPSPKGSVRKSDQAPGRVCGASAHSTQ